jgi:hypothetical protein
VRVAFQFPESTAVILPDRPLTSPSPSRFATEITVEFKINSCPLSLSVSYFPPFNSVLPVSSSVRALKFAAFIILPEAVKFTHSTVPLFLRPPSKRTVNVPSVAPKRVPLIVESLVSEMVTPEFPESFLPENTVSPAVLTFVSITISERIWTTSVACGRIPPTQVAGLDQTPPLAVELIVAAWTCQKKAKQNTPTLPRISRFI